MVERSSNRSVPEKNRKMNVPETYPIDAYRIIKGDERSKAVGVRYDVDKATDEPIFRLYLQPDQSVASFPDRSEVAEILLNYSLVESDETSTVCYLENERASFLKSSLNIPVMIRCQNCETLFPTKYQYQRHQCEFDSNKVVLKPNVDMKDVDKGVRIKYVCGVCKKEFVSQNNLSRHELSHKDVAENVCEYCNKRFISGSRLTIHKENHCKKAGDVSKFYRSDVVVWKCTSCHEVFSNAELAGLHVTKAPCRLSFEVPTEDRFEKISTEILVQCEFCNKTFSDKTFLLGHQSRHVTGKSYECADCASTFDSYATAVDHWARRCAGGAGNVFYLPRLTYCAHCDRTFKSHELLYTHKMKKKHYTAKRHNVIDAAAADADAEGGKNDAAGSEENQDKDSIGKLVADVLNTLDVPMLSNVDFLHVEQDNEERRRLQVGEEEEDEEERAETSASGKKKRGRKRKGEKGSIPNGKRPPGLAPEGYKFQCERCIKVFDAVEDMEDHREQDHAANFSCEECGHILHSAKALLIHTRSHRSLKPYVCETCGKSYSQTSHLWQHMRFHQGIKPFACPHEGCEARYTIRPDLKDHIRKVHTRERPFKCLICSKSFLTGSVYYQHRLIHTNDRRYACELCPKKFFRADALNNHKRIHTDERPYACEFCGREFRQKGDRNKHVRTQHQAQATT